MPFAIPMDCSPSAATCRSNACSPPTGAASSRGTARISRSCGGRPIRARCSSPGELRISRSLRRTLRKNRFTVSVDRDFDGVIAACARDRDDPGTWITAEMREAYRELHRVGAAHSVEAWQDEELAGGLYGVNIGGVYFGESMFSRHSDASKVALVRLVALCREAGIRLIDCQLASAHLATLGARQISRGQFEALLQKQVGLPSPAAWSRPAEPTAAWFTEPG